MFWGKRERLQPLPVAGRQEPVLRPSPGASRDRFYWALKHRTGDADRGTRYALRALVFYAGAVTAAMLMLASSFSALLPLRRDVPYFLEDYAEERAVVDVRPAKRIVEGESEQVRREIATFVRVMFEVVNDLDEMDRRWGPGCQARQQGISYSDEFDRLCSYIYLRTHVAGRATKAWPVFTNELSRVKAFIDEGKSRTVRILGDPIRRTADTWEVRFETTEWRNIRATDITSAPFTRQVERKGKVERVKKEAIFLKVGFNAEQPAQRNIAYRLNPLQFTVWEILDITAIPE